MNFELCKQFNNTPCRFLSNETLLVPYNQLIENPKTNRLEPSLQTMLRIEPIGQFCNNCSKWCKEIVQCPARIAIAYEPWTGCKVEGAGSYAKLVGSMEMKALMSERVPGQMTLEGVV